MQLSTINPYHKSIANQMGGHKSNTFLFSLIKGSWFLLGFMALLQCIFFPGLINVLCIAYIALAWAFTTTIFLTPQVLKSYPLSSFLIIGFASTQFYFPLIFTTIEGKALIYNLQIPLRGFLHSTLTLLVLIATHALYRTLSFQRISRPSKGPYYLQKLALFKTPSDQQVWLMGMLGLSSMFYSSFILNPTGDVEVGITGKIVEGLMAFTYAPFFIPFGILYGRKKSETKSLVTKLLLFTVILFMVSIGRNSRGAFMIGFTSLGFAFGLGLMLGAIKTRLLSLKYAVIATIALWLITGPFADLGTAMLLVRHQRNDMPKSELLALTLAAYKNKPAIEEYKINAKEEKKSDWDEKYLDNIFLARFCNIKFNDASLLLAAQIKEDNHNMRDFSINRIWTTLPKPLLNLLNPGLNKDKVNSNSFGDYMRFQISKSHYHLGSFVTGHLSGTGMAAFGWWYLAIVAAGMLPVYFLIDLLHVKKYLTAIPSLQIQGIERRFSLCAMLNLTAIFQFLPSESVVSILQFLLRGWVQMILLYCVFFHLTKILTVLIRPITLAFKN